MLLLRFCMLVHPCLLGMGDLLAQPDLDKGGKAQN